MGDAFLKLIKDEYDDIVQKSKEEKLYNNEKVDTNINSASDTMSEDEFKEDAALPEIVYPKNPDGKIYANIDAIREVKRLDDAIQNGHEPYDSRSNQYNSRENSNLRLRRYCGWGGLQQAFEEKPNNWQNKQLKDLLTDDVLQFRHFDSEKFLVPACIQSHSVICKDVGFFLCFGEVVNIDTRYFRDTFLLCGSDSAVTCDDFKITVNDDRVDKAEFTEKKNGA